MAYTPEWASRARVVMLGKPGCHLCEDAWAVIERVTAELGASRARHQLDDVTGDEREEYWDKVPVTFVDGRRHDFWRVGEDRLRAALGN
ncbi:MULTISPECIES: glutaredoxin family protein [unclassified Nocardiopsis]|uniref:glutaredoxin family protein n=1 Tax=unclassified Nocardiopsis TaxID=2649073 RepID=UPI001356D417|nr:MULTISPECIES: glutaredoxin family protein [unclassified Nocardiopsis]